MLHKDLEDLIDTILKETKNTFSSKNKEYSREDALSNFKKAGEAMGCTPEHALLGMLTKHWVSVVDMIHDIDDNKVGDEALWREKCGDIRVYAMLLEGLIIDRIESNKKQKGK